MSNLSSVAKKMLLNQSFFEDGYEYQFLSVELEKDGWTYHVVVNVILPKKGQSYATPIFSYHIHNILSNLWKYVGDSFSYSEKLLIDGEEPVNKGVFISEEKQTEVLSVIRKDFKEVTLWTAVGTLTFEVYWKPMKNFYTLDDVYIDFNFDIEIRNFMLDSHYVVPNLNIADDVSGAILNVMYDTDTLREGLNNVIYDVMDNEMDISSVDDLYYQVRFYITKIDGIEVSGHWGNHYDLEPNMFT